MLAPLERLLPSTAPVTSSSLWKVIIRRDFLGHQTGGLNIKNAASTLVYGAILSRLYHDSR
jgi:hypothetical protein